VHDSPMNTHAHHHLAAASATILQHHRQRRTTLATPPAGGRRHRRTPNHTLFFFFSRTRRRATRLCIKLERSTMLRNSYNAFRPALLIKRLATTTTMAGPARACPAEQEPKENQQPPLRLNNNHFVQTTRANVLSALERLELASKGRT
jgi:hypothetical protein